MPVHEKHPNQQFSAQTPREVWMKDGFTCPASWILYTRQVVGFQMGSWMTKEPVLSALERAYQAHRPASEVLHHSDRTVSMRLRNTRKSLWNTA
ncbi:hypothetical protein ACWA2B_06060 [Paenibacillus sp. CMM36]